MRISELAAGPRSRGAGWPVWSSGLTRLVDRADVLAEIAHRASARSPS
jgi:hypothetical protein